MPGVSAGRCEGWRRESSESIFLHGSGVGANGWLGPQLPSVLASVWLTWGLPRGLVAGLQGLGAGGTSRIPSVDLASESRGVTSASFSLLRQSQLPLESTEGEEIKLLDG